MKNTNWRSFLVLIVLHLAFMYSAHAEDEKQKQKFTYMKVNYSVIDMIQKQKREEIWHVQLYSDPNDYYVVKKVSNENGKLLSTVWKDTWRQVTYIYGKEYYLYQDISRSITISGNTIEAFGRVEVKYISGSETIDAWPLFLKIEQKGNIVTMTKTIFLSGKGKITITKIYTEGQEFFPTHEREEFFKETGEKVVDLLYSRM